MTARWMGTKIVRVSMLGLGLVWLAGCGGASLEGSVEGIGFSTIEDGFYTEFEFEDDTYQAIVLTDFEDACNKFNAVELDLGSQYSVLQMWLTAPDPQPYGVYAEHFLKDAEPNHGLAYYSVVLNDTDVLNAEAVAGLVEIQEYAYDEKVLTGNMELVFGGSDNRLQGTFTVPYCEVDWNRASEFLLK